MILHIIFDPQGHSEVMDFGAHSLVINDHEYPIVSAWKQMGNGWFNSEYVLNQRQVLAIKDATSVGVIVQAGYGAPVFLSE